MDSVSQWGTGLLLVGGALLCGLLILIGGILVAVLRSGILGDLLAGLGGAVDMIGDEPEGRSRVLPRAGRARARARAVREKVDQEFHGADAADHPAASDFNLDTGAPSVEESLPRQDAASRARERRRRSEFDDFQDELDAFFDDTEL